MDKDISKNRHISKQVQFILLPIIGICLPLIYYIISFAPTLTESLSKILAYCQFLNDNNAHFYADGWNSSIYILPLSTKYFLTYSCTPQTTWTNALLISVTMSYGLMSVAILLLIYALRPKKILTCIIYSCIACALGFYSLLTSYSCNSFMLFSTIAIFSAAFLSLGMHAQKNLKIKIIVSCLCIIPTILLLIFTSYSSKAVSTTDVISNELYSTFTSAYTPGAKNSESLDCQTNSAKVISYLNSLSIPVISSDASTSNIISVCSGRTLKPATSPSLSAIDSPIDTDCEFISTIDITSTHGGFAYIVPNSMLSVYSKYIFLSSNIYRDDYYTVYTFSNASIFCDETILTDLLKLNSDKYDTVLLSMYDVSNYDISYFDKYMAWTCISADYCFSDINLVEDYNHFIFSGKNNISQYIFCVDPYIIYSETEFNQADYTALLQKELIDVVNLYENTTFYIYLPSYSITHFANYTIDELSLLRESYYILADSIESCPNVKLYYAGFEEYVYNNPYLYETGSDCLMLYELENQMLLNNLADITLKSADELPNCIDTLINGIIEKRTQPLRTYDFSNYCAVICGDSIFANTTNNFSIQNNLNNFSGMNYILRAIGGSTATTIDGDTTTLKYQLNIDAINDQLISANQTDKQLLFFIEFGLNDYFQGMPLNNSYNKYDENTYSGMIRTGIELIKEEWPDSEIIIFIPGYITMYENGTLKPFYNSHLLNEFRATAQQLAQEYDTYCFDQCELGFTQAEADIYLADHVHYNEKGLYTVAQSLMNYIYTEIYNEY